MRIQNNITAMNTHRMYTTNNNAVAKSAEKLSSGYRINRAGDDAAGLAISEKMRSQIRGLNMASKNSQDAISLIQTAEGALQEVHSMLQRMNELANQAATGTNQTFDRDQINAEFNQLKDEIDQIADTTQFNKMKLLDGSLGVGAMGVSAGAFLPQGEKTAALTTASAVIAKQLSGITANKEGSYAMAYGTLNATTGAFTASAAYDANAVIQVTFTATDGSKSVTNLKADDVFRIKNNTASGAVDTAALASGMVAGDVAVLDFSKVGLGKYELTAGGAGSAANLITDIGLFAPTLTETGGVAGSQNELVIQVGANEHETLSISVGRMNTEGLGIAASEIDDQTKAGRAITATQDAVDLVSAQRATLGAMQNRLEHKIANLDNTSENLSAAESRIRDVDIAKEMTAFTKNNILSQAATAMLAQANAAPQGVLSLLQ